nr:polysaccharide lyase 8 family protein [Cohnella zeiphila]
MLTGGTDFDPLVPEFAGIIERITETAEAWRTSLRREEDCSCLWDDLNDWSNTAALTSNYTRIWQMALACRTFGSPLYRRPEWERDVIEALDWMRANHYFAGAEMYGNWWDWHIGVPMKLLDCMTLLYDRLSERQRADYLAAIDHFKPHVAPTATGANRVWECRIIAVRGIVGKDGGKLAAARDELRPVFPYAEEKDGFYRDGSYIQHDTFAYTGGYGQSLLQELSSLIVLLDGSPWEIGKDDREQAYRWIFDSYEPLMYKGLMMDMAMGRVVSRKEEQNHNVGHIIVSSVVKLSQVAEGSDAVALKSMAKEWIRANEWLNFYSAAGLSTAVAAKRIENDADVPPRGELRMHKSFARMARTVHHRPGFAFAISMHSDRISNYESINREHLRGWHTADGMTYLYNGDLGQYADAFWPTVDSFRLPGTTVLRGTEVPANRPSDRSWAGGTELLGAYGAAGMELHPPGQSLAARKSWFLFDDEIAALGSDISAEEPIMAETIVENRMLNREGNNRLTVDGEPKPDRAGWSERMDGARWMHLQGSVPGSDIGYFFPEPATVHGFRESRSGRWHDINRFEPESDPALTRAYLALWLEHGAAPRHASYAYVLLPNRSADETERYAQAPAIEVLANTAEVHAVRHRKLRVTGMNCWIDGGAEAGGIRADRPSSVLTIEREGRLDVAISDPTFRKDGIIGLEIAREAEAVLSRDPAISVLSLAPVIRLAVDAREAGGRTLDICFSTGG